MKIFIDLLLAKYSSPLHKDKVGATLYYGDELLAKGFNHPVGSVVGELHSCCHAEAVAPYQSECVHCGAPDYKIVTMGTVVHAEVDALLKAKLSTSSYEVEKLKMYVTRAPCASCRALLRRYGIKWEVKIC